MVADSGNNSDSNNPQPVKRRTRIKVNQSLTSKSVNSLAQAENVANEKGTISNEISEKIDGFDNDQSSDDDTRTYEIEKPESKPDEKIEVEVDYEADEEVFTLENLPDSPTKGSVPTPAPRTKITQQNIISDESHIRAEEEEEGSAEHKRNSPPVSPPPQPRPRTVKEVEVEKVKKKKKLKAAEVISSVLKHENKKVGEIVAPLPELDEKEEGMGSPWDSPPPPQILDKVYIQHKHGFSVHDWGDLFKKLDYKSDTPRNKSLTDVALQFHDLWSRFMMFSHGVVAGLACCHILSVAAVLASTQNDVEQFVHFYHFLSLKVHFAVYVFTSLCIVSCFDRLDIGELTKSHVREIARAQGALLTTTAYLFCLMLSLAAHRHTAAIEDYKTNHDLWNAQGLQEWYWLVTTRDIVLLVIWIFIAFSPRSDLLRDKLSAMGEKQVHVDPIFNIDLQQN